MNDKEFVAAVTAAVRASTLPDYAKKSPAEIAESLAKNEVYVAAELSDDEPKVGQSKVGGAPDVDASFKWPCEEDSDDPLQFVAQFNLAEIHPHDFNNRLPASGMLYFFSIADGDRAGGGEVDESTTKVVFAAKPGKLEPHPIPESLSENEDATIEEHPLEFGPTLGMDGINDSGIRDVIVEAIREAGGRDGPVYLLHKHDDGKAGAASLIYLADIDGYRIAPNAFGEGILGFAVAPKALAKGDLAKAETFFQGGS